MRGSFSNVEDPNGNCPEKVVVLFQDGTKWEITQFHSYCLEINLGAGRVAELQMSFQFMEYKDSGF